MLILKNLSKDQGGLLENAEEDIILKQLSCTALPHWE